MKIHCFAAVSLLAFGQTAFSSNIASAAKSSQADRKPGISQGAAKPAAPALAANYGKLPLSFEANQGQSNPQVKFTSRGSGYSLFLTDSAAVLALTKDNPASNGNQNKLSGAGKKPMSDSLASKTDVIRMELTGASHKIQVTGADQLPGTANYFIGNDPSKWHSQVPTYAKVKYSGVYPGVDLVYYGNQRQLEYDFVLAPMADPKQVRLHFGGAKKLRLNADGDLTVSTLHGEIAFDKPIVYQLKGGRRQSVEGQFCLRGKNTLGFSLGQYDPTQPLVIDPVLAYSTFLGGGGFAYSGYSGDEGVNGGRGTQIAADNAGNVYLAGTTGVFDFPVTAGSFQGAPGGTYYTGNGSYSFVLKLDPTGSNLIYSTYFGGKGEQQYTTGNSWVDGTVISSMFVDSGGRRLSLRWNLLPRFPNHSGRIYIHEGVGRLLSYWIRFQT